MSGVSALLALRQVAAQGQQPTYSNDRQQILLNGTSYPRTTLTPYRTRDKKSFFPLDALCFFLEDALNKNSTISQYLEAAHKQGVIPVSVVQKKDLLAYLKGEVDSSPFIDLQGYEKDVGTRDVEMGGEEGRDGESSKRQRVGEGGAYVKPVNEWTVEDILREEVPISTHLSVLQAPKKSLAHILDLYHKASGETRSKKDGRDSKSSSSSSSKHDKSKSITLANTNMNGTNFGIPIIVVPAAVSAVINMYNVTQLLENGVFVSGDEIRAKNPTMKKPSMLTISRSSHYDPSKQVKYQITDDVTQLKTDDDWNRVVGVFVSGAAWQFGDWPKKKWANPAAIFENVCAFHLHFDDEALHPNILNWRTHRLPISKSKRHGDRGVVLDFWKLLTDFVASRNTTKRLNI